MLDQALCDKALVGKEVVLTLGALNRVLSIELPS